MKFLTYLAAIVLCSVSIFCSVTLFYKDQPSLEYSIIFAASAFGLELCKFIFFPKARESSGWSKFSLNFFGSLLVVFSIFCTISMLESGATSSISDEMKSSFEYQTRLKDVQNLESELQINMEAKDKAVKNNYRKEARTYDIKIEDLKSQKENKLKLLNDITIISASGTHSIFDSIASKFEVSVVLVRQISYLIIALLVDLGGIRCLMILTKPENDETHDIKGLDPVSDPLTKQALEPVLISEPVPVSEPVPKLDQVLEPVSSPVQSVSKKSKNIEKAVEMIVSGKLGENPSINKVAKNCGVGKPKAKIIIAEANKLILESRQEKVIQIKNHKV